MKIKKIITIIIALAMVISMMLTAAFNAAAADGIDLPATPVITQDSDYACIEGVIKEINDYIGVDGKAVENKFIVGIENEKEEGVWNAIIDSGTYSITLGNTDVTTITMSVGDSVKVFYDANAPWLMIYPPQVNAEFIALNFDETKFITIARFDADFISEKDSLKLNISEETEIVYEDGKEFDDKAEELINRKLVVIYSITTRSIPAITTPEKIIVMYEKAVAPVQILTDEEKEEYAKSFETADIAVNGEVIGSLGAFLTDDGILMVPVRAVAEALGYGVEWFEDTQSVQLGKSLMFSIGEDSYSFARMAPTPLGAAPVLKDNRTFVPIDVFNLPVPSQSGNIRWYLADGQLHIESVPQETEE